MKKFIKLALVTLCLSLSAAALLACKDETPDTPTAKTELETPVIASAVYNGETQVADVPESEGYTVTTNDGGIHAGEYAVVLTLTDSAKYAWKSPDANGSAALTLKFSITQADNRIKSFTLKGWSYGEPANAPTASADFGTPVFTYSSARDGEFAATVPTEIGTYFVKAAVEETADYKGAEEIKSFKIATNNPTFTTKPAAIGELKYNGKEHTLITKGEVTKGTAQYKLGEDGEWGETLPVATKAGTYTVYYKVVDGDGNAFDEASLDVTIAKTSKIPGLTVKNDGVVWCGNQTADITAEIGNSRLLTLEFSKDVNDDGTLKENAAFVAFDKLLEGDIGNGLIYYVKASVANDDCFENAVATVSFTLNHKFVDGVCSSCNHDQSGISYTEKDGVVTVTGYNGKSKEVYVRKTYNGKNVTSIRSYTEKNAEGEDVWTSIFKDRTDITKIVLPDTITELKTNTFFGCKNLEYLAIPGVTTLADNTQDEKGNIGYGNIFTFCDNLKTLIVKAGLTITGQQLRAQSVNSAGKTNIFVVGDGTVTVNNRDRNNLFNAAYPYNGGGTAKCDTWSYDDHGNAVLATHEYSDGVCSKCGAFGEEKTKGVKFVYDSASDSYFVSGYGGTEESVTVIGAYNDGAHGLKKVTAVANGAAWGSTVKKIILPASVTDFKGNSFESAANLEYISMTGVTHISTGNNFINNTKITTVIVNKNFILDNQQFKMNGITADATVIIYVDGKKSESTFAYVNRPSDGIGNEFLTGVVYYKVDDSAEVKCLQWKFDDNGAIVKGANGHTFENGVCTICGEKDAMGVVYKYDSSLSSYYVAGYTGSATEITVFDAWNDGENGEAAVTYVATSAFSGNKTIKKVILPSSVTELKGGVFLTCSALEYVDMRGVTTLSGNNNFLNCGKLETVIIGDGYQAKDQQFVIHGDNSLTAVINLYVYGSTKITLKENDKLVKNTYYYSETQETGKWHFVGDVPTLW